MKTLIINLILAIIGLFCLIACHRDNDVSPTTAVPPAFTDAAARAKALVANYALAASVAAVKEDRLLWSGGYGLANKETGKPATDETVFLIASVSKTITSVAVMQLVEQGKLSLDTDINQYLPFKLTNPKAPQTIITCRRLMTHTSGIIDAHYNQVSNPAFYTFGADPKLSLADLITAFFTPGGQYFSQDTFVAGGPGQAYAYSNMGIALLGYIVERVAGKPFYQSTKETIFSPLGMNKTSWRVQDFQTADLAMPYDATNKPYGHYTFADYPDGGLRTTVKDLSLFLRAIMMGGSLNGKRILTSASVAELLRVQYPTLSGAEGQGLVWFGIDPQAISTTPLTGGPSILLGHDGAEQGVLTFMYFDPQTRAGGILFSNKDLTTDAMYQDLIALEYALIKTATAQ